MLSSDLHYSGLLCKRFASEGESEEAVLGLKQEPETAPSPAPALTTLCHAPSPAPQSQQLSYIQSEFSPATSSQQEFPQSAHQSQSPVPNFLQFVPDESVTQSVLAGCSKLPEPALPCKTEHNQ